MLDWTSYFYEIALLLLGQTIDAIKSFNMFTPQGGEGGRGSRGWEEWSGGGGGVGGGESSDLLLATCVYAKPRALLASSGHMKMVYQFYILDFLCK